MRALCERCSSPLPHEAQASIRSYQCDRRCAGLQAGGESGWTWAGQAGCSCCSNALAQVGDGGLGWFDPESAPISRMVCLVCSRRCAVDTGCRYLVRITRWACGI